MIGLSRTTLIVTSLRRALITGGARGTLSESDVDDARRHLLTQQTGEVVALTDAVVSRVVSEITPAAFTCTCFGSRAATSLHPSTIRRVRRGRCLTAFTRAPRAEVGGSMVGESSLAVRATSVCIYLLSVWS
ncbi:unnamed protein product [Vitrella brassicaformis CCMP3155]|uniref:Uncharacterized protein n=1 Tax=Vitrella brassicaformis (strain CCMP3155) TaxID=1169540 RepID=A0A0G4EFE3_VITBC|nr:unnamed protein product [Vitrella brassicaformis CCMP3155]|eukprot:CEL94226.1 unnamed protein product [Vitrella brassicaformis CCMP3155]